MGFGFKNLGEDAAGSSLHQSELQEARRNYKWRTMSGTSRYIKMTKVPMYFWYHCWAGHSLGIAFYSDWPRERARREAAGKRVRAVQWAGNPRRP